MIKHRPMNPSIETLKLMEERNAECLCGSGRKFKECCSDNLPGFEIGEKALAALNRSDNSVALAATRADITQYSIWHRTNTVPVLRIDPQLSHESAQYLLNVDVVALSEYVDRLRTCYDGLGMADEFPATLERLRSNIDHSKWQRRVIYLQTLHALSSGWDRDAGRQELKKLGAMETETDVEILQLYIDLFGDQLGFAERFQLVDRIVRFSPGGGEKLHYRCLKAIGYLMAGDKSGAETEIRAALDTYETTLEQTSESLYAKDRYGRALDLLGRLSDKTELLDQSIAVFEEILRSDRLSLAGKAETYRQLGDSLRFKQDWRAALAAYGKAFESQPQQIFHVFVAECELNLGGPAVAATVLKSVIPTELDASEYADYIFTYALIATTGGDKELLSSAEQLLRKLSISEPFFQRQRDALLISVVDIQRFGPSNAQDTGLKLSLTGQSHEGQAKPSS